MQVDLHRVSTPDILSIILSNNKSNNLTKVIVKSRFFKRQQGKRKLPSFDEWEVRTEKRRKYATFHNLSGRLLFIDLSIA